MSELINKLDATTIPVMPKEYRKYQTMNCDDAYEQGWNDLQRCIEELPSAKSDPEWIPVSERLPEKSGRYLITTFGILKREYVEIAGFNTASKEFAQYDLEYGYVPVDDVIAWMPLPEPARLDGESE